MKKKGLLGFYDYTVVLTYCGMLLGLLGVILAMSESFTLAILCLMGAGVCDTFDGAVASTKKNRTDEERRFGIQIDSLCDLVSFGVMPGLFLYCFMGRSVLGAVVGLAFALCGLIRLAYFNVTEEQRQTETTERRKFYQGVPITMVSLLLPLIYILYQLFSFSPYIVLGVMALLALCFILPVKLPKAHGVWQLLLLGLGVLEGGALLAIHFILKV